jgi:very-short-patch-repair endonuclease
LPLKLIIEVDGSTLDTEVQYAKDKIRDEKLKSLGFTILRINDSDVLTKISSVANYIGSWIDQFAVVPPPSPRQRGKA